MQKISGKEKRGRLKFSALPELNIPDVDGFKMEEKNVSAEQEKDMLEVSETTEIKTENINDSSELMNFEEEQPPKKQKNCGNTENYCPYCNFRHKNFTNLKIHIESNHPLHEKKKFFCDDCEASFMFDISLKIHKSQKHTKACITENSGLRCDICLIEYSSQKLMKSHNFKHHGILENKENLCPICDHKALNFSNLKLHIDQEHQEQFEKKYFCDECSQGFIFEDSYKKHSHPINVSCELCSIEFTSKKLLKSHYEENHEIDGQKVCLYCDYFAKDLASLKIHIDNKHQEHSKSKYFCDLCQRGFIFDTSLKKHQDLHKSYAKQKGLLRICDICGQKYHSAGLKEHMRQKHPKNDAKTFICEVCGFSAITAALLARHKYRKHQVEKHKKCPHCEFKASCSQKIKIHVDRNHSEHYEQKLSCACGKKFIYDQSLKQHSSYECIHSKYRKEKKVFDKHKRILQIPCCYCEKVFNNSYSAKNHYKKDHLNQPILFEGSLKKYSCDECEDFFFSDKELKEHLYRNHGRSKINKDKTFPPKEGITRIINLQCDHCQEILRTTRLAKIHYQTCHPTLEMIAPGRNRYSCTQCSEFFFLQDELDCHLNLDHDVKMDKVYCKQCKRSCKDLNLHICNRDYKYPVSNVERKKRKQRMCPHCDKVFSDLANMKSHVKSAHEQIYEFECKHCDKKLASAKTLKGHILQCHSKEKSVCLQCGKVFSSPGNLTSHSKSAHKQI